MILNSKRKITRIEKENGIQSQEGATNKHKHHTPEKGFAPEKLCQGEGAVGGVPMTGAPPFTPPPNTPVGGEPNTEPLMLEGPNTPPEEPLLGTEEEEALVYGVMWCVA